MPTVTHLLYKTGKKEPMTLADSLSVSPQGIADAIPHLPLRQVLLLPETILHEFGLQPGDLNENIVIEGIDLHDIPSGTVLTIGDVRLRLTFHCEPCLKVKHLAPIKSLMHKRGYFGTFLNAGQIHTGDEVQIGPKEFEAIPYDIKDRIRWFLDHQTGSVTIPELCYGVGLSRGYYRAIPGILRRMRVKE